MIRTACEQDLLELGVGEAALRIVAAYETYGLQTRFLQLFADECETRMSLMDGVAVLHAPHGLNEEWISFLSMQPNVRAVRTDAVNAESLAARWGCVCKTGDFMSYDGGATAPTVIDFVRYEDLYDFLSEYFTMPPFECWYVDVSHRVRHDVCHIASVVRDGRVVCNAMSVAETTEDVLLGAVATHPDWRRQGLAAGCIGHLLHQLSDTHRIHISPVDERARRLYEKLGFRVTGSWGEVLCTQTEV